MRKILCLLIIMVVLGFPSDNAAAYVNDTISKQSEEKLQNPLKHLQGENKENRSLKDVLLIYDSLAIGTSKEGNVAELQRMLASFGMNITAISSDQYEQKMLDQFPYIIVIRNNSTLYSKHNSHLKGLSEALKHVDGKYMHIGYEPPSYLQHALGITVTQNSSEVAKLTVHQFSADLTLDDTLPLIHFRQSNKRVISYGSMETAANEQPHPYAVSNDKFAYISYYEQANISQWASSDIFQKWLGKEEQHHMYLLLTEVYPFSDLERLRYLADELYEVGIPFIVSSSPLFSNFNYPAAKRYAGTLKYMQAKNGSILVRAPNVSSQTIAADRTVLKTEMSAYIDFLASHDVAALGTAAEMYWFKDTFFQNAGLSFFNSGIILPDMKPMNLQASNELRSLDHHVYSIELGQWIEDAGSNSMIGQKNLPIPIALSMNLQQAGIDELNDQLEWLKHSWFIFDDYKLMEHQTVTDQFAITSSNGMLRINGIEVNTSDQYHEISSQYQYVDEQEVSFQSLINVQNKLFIVVILIVLLIFSVLLMIGVRMYRRKY